MTTARPIVQARQLTRDAFLPYGEVIDIDGAERFSINQGKCTRYHALAQATALGADAGIIISIFHSQPYSMPLELGMVERHPLGSQAFMPLDPLPFLVVVCPDAGGMPGHPEAFVPTPFQGVNYFANVWHGVVTPLQQAMRFLVVDRSGEGANLEEHHFETPFIVSPA